MPTGCIHYTSEDLKSTGHLLIDGREGWDGVAIILHSRCDPAPSLAGRGRRSRGEGWREGYGVGAATAWARIERRGVDLLCAHDNEGEGMT